MAAGRLLTDVDVIDLIIVGDQIYFIDDSYTDTAVYILIDQGYGLPPKPGFILKIAL